MARINYPGTILEWIELFKKLKTTVSALVTPNSFDSYLTLNGISLDTDDTNADAAKAAHLLAADKEKEGEKKMEEANQLWNACKDRHRNMAQNLKSMHRDDVRAIGAWGIQVDNVSKLVYKTKPVEHAEEMRALITKHTSYVPVTTSPLQGFITTRNINIAQHGLDITAALAAFAASAQAHADSETQTELCNNLLFPIIDHIRGLGQTAMTLYVTEPHKAGDLGFTIDANKRPSKLRTIELEPGQELDMDRIDVGTFITVDGPGSVQIMPKGKRAALKAAAEPGYSTEGGRGVINKDGKFLVTFGYGSSTLKNMDLTSKMTVYVYINQ